MNMPKQMSESIYLGVLLAVTGGFMDACAFIGRGGVFANAQTGNILLLSLNLAQQRWAASLLYLLPILAFISGIALADMSRYQFQRMKTIHWRQATILVEIIIFFIVGFIGHDKDVLANCLISLACGIQVESFRKINNTSIATTMCIGNLRGATQAIIEYWHTKDKNTALKGALFFCFIFCFGIGAIIGNFFITLLGARCIWICCGLLAVGFAMMFINGEKYQPPCQTPWKA